MRKIICDRCGKEIPQGTRTGYIAVNWRAASDNSLMLDNPYENDDFCEDCMKNIVNVIDFNIKVEVREASVDAGAEEVEDGSEEDPVDNDDDDEDEEEEEEPEPDPPPVVKKGVNYTKLRELVKAGKEPREIAEELGITMKQYYYARKRAEQLYIAGRI